MRTRAGLKPAPTPVFLRHASRVTGTWRVQALDCPDETCKGDRRSPLRGDRPADGRVSRSAGQEPLSACDAMRARAGLKPPLHLCSYGTPPGRLERGGWRPWIARMRHVGATAGRPYGRSSRRRFLRGVWWLMKELGVPVSESIGAPIRLAATFADLGSHHSRRRGPKSRSFDVRREHPARNA